MSSNTFLIKQAQKLTLFLFISLGFIVNTVHSQTLGQFTFTGAGCTSNTVTSQPAHATISPYTSTSVTCGSVTNAYGQSDWNTTPSINTSEYNEFTITPSTGYVLTLTNLTFTHYTSTFFGTANWTLRSSLDGYTSNLGTGSSNQVPASASTTFTANSAFTNSGAVTFRLYVTSANVNTTVWTNDNMTITGTTVACTPPSAPGNPTSNSPQCSPTGVTITKSGSAPGGVTWYWQDSNASGTSTSLNATTAYTATTTGTYYIRAQDNTGGCWSTSSGSVTVTVNPTPTITLGNTPTVCFGTTTTTLSYSGTSNSPDKYSITYDATALAAGFTNVSNATLPSSPITLSLTATGAGTYNYTVTVKNNSTGCVSSGTAKTITLNSPATVTPGGPDQAAQSATPSGITLTGASVGGEATTGAWSITSGGGTLSSISQTGSPQSVSYTPAASYSGTAVLTLTTNSLVCSSTSGNRIITIDPATSQSYVTAGAYTFTVPACVNSAIVECWGAGGGGGGNGQNEDGGGGGGGGAYSKSTFTLTPGATYTVNVGTGGAGGTSAATDGSNGGDTWFINSTSILAKGGAKGLKQTGSGGTAGAGGAGGAAGSGVGTTKYSGGNGATGTNGGTFGSNIGGGGGSSAGNASDGNDAPTPAAYSSLGGTAPTGGGNGGVASSIGAGPGISPGGGGGTGGSYSYGGTGAAGKVVISWINTLAISSNTITAATACVSTTNSPIHSFSVNGNNACITDVSFVTTGNYTAAEITNFKLYYTTTNTFSTSNLLATIASPTVAGTQTFPTFSVAFSNTTRYFWITMDVAATVTDGHTIAVSSTGPSNITSATTATGSGNASGTQTLKANASINLTSAGGSNNQSKCINTALTTITYTVGGGATGATITGLPTGVTGTYSTGTVTISGTPTVTGTSNYTIATTGICTQTSTTGTITVNALPTITSNNATICTGQTATLTATGGLTSYSWLPGGATTSSITISPTSNTSYTVTGINANGCSASAVASVTVNALPSITVNNATICTGTTATLSATTGLTSYSWSPGGATTSSITVSPSSTTSYTVTGTNTNGCPASAVASVTVNALPTVTVNSPSICTGSTTTLTASGATDYLWSTGATTTSITVSPSSTATFVVTGSTTSCATPVTSTVTVNSLPSISVNSPAICTGFTATLIATGGVSYSWSTGETTATITPSPTSNTSYTVTGINVNGCSASAVATVTVNSFPTVTVNNATICAGQIATLTATGGTSYTWNTGETTATITPSPTSTTSYTVTVNPATSCSVTAIASVTVNALPTVGAMVSPGGTICVGTSVTLSGTGASSYSWTAGVTNGSAFTPTVTTTYTVTGTDAYSCAGTYTITITVASVYENADSTIWSGAINNSWFLSCNWNGGLPSATKNVIIPAGLSIYPVISGTGTAESRSLRIDSLATLTTSGTKNLNVYGNWTNRGAFIPNYGSITFKGGNNQYITVAGDTITGDTLVRFNKLVVHKTAGKLFLQTSASVTDSLLLTKGIVVTSINALTLLDTAVAKNGSDSSYVSGFVSKQGSTSFTFPLGDTLLTSGAYHPLSITAPTDTTNIFSARYLATGQVSNLVLTPTDTLGNFVLETPIQTDSIESLSDCEHWVLIREEGTAIVIPTISWNTNSCNISDPDNIVVAGKDTSMWVSMGKASHTVNGSKGTLTAARGINLDYLSLVIGQQGGFSLNTVDLVDTTTAHDTATTLAKAQFEALFGSLPVDTTHTTPVAKDTLMYSISGAPGITGTYHAGGIVKFSKAKIAEPGDTITVAFYTKLAGTDTASVKDTVKIMFDLDRYKKVSNVRIAYTASYFITITTDSLPVVDSTVLADPALVLSDSVKALMNTENNFNNTQQVENFKDTIAAMDAAYYSIIKDRALVLLSGRTPKPLVDSTPASPVSINLEGGILMSPNSDGISDNFVVTNNVPITTYHLKITDVNNTTIYETSTLSAYWDGKDVTSTLVPVGNYFYEITPNGGQPITGQFLVEY